MFQANTLRQALSTLGSLLLEQGREYEIVACGGGGLLLLGVIRRPTKDLDALTATALGLAADWLNPGPTDQLKQGLPVGFRERTTVERFGGLILHLAGRFDQICLKLYAAADSGPESKHVRDLMDLDPDDAELGVATAWVKEQDTGVEFGRFVDAVVAHLGVARARE